MKSIERKFNNVKKDNPHWSSYICFAETVKNQNVNEQTLNRWFNKLVEKDDYSRSDKETILSELNELTKPAEEYKI